jgi:sec-independent protein translocase protein TatC
MIERSKERDRLAREKQDAAEEAAEKPTDKSSGQDPS